MKFGVNFLIFVMFFVTSCMAMKLKRQVDHEINECQRSGYQELLIDECCDIIEFIEVKKKLEDKCLQEITEKNIFKAPDGLPSDALNDHLPVPSPNLKSERQKNYGRSSLITPCMDECIFNKTGKIGSDGKLKEDVVQITMLKRITNKGFPNAVVQFALEKCLKPNPKNQYVHPVCTSGAFEFVNCFRKQLFMKCPADKWSNTDECVNMRDQLKKCEKQ